jgi:3-oxoacyl-[acyl-carrier-protein] synthase II
MMERAAVVTGLGMVTPLGASPGEVLRRIRSGQCAAARPTRFDPAPFACPVCAEVKHFDPQQHVPEPKAIRMMNRDSLLAVAAARYAMADAGVEIGRDYPPEDVALFGATGLAGIALSEVSRLVESSAAPDGALDLKRFGALALKQVRPMLSFKILSNMPMCFVSIFQRIQGPNAIYNPWEGQGAHAIASAMHAIRRGHANCALAGGCDVKTHELGFIALEQCGVLRSWRTEGAGCVPGEGAAFLVLEDELSARSRGARIYARLLAHRNGTISNGSDPLSVYADVLAPLALDTPHACLSAQDGDAKVRQAEEMALDQCRIHAQRRISPKPHLGNLFAAAAAVQVALAAAVASETQPGRKVLANCFGHGCEQAAFVLEAV